MYKRIHTRNEREAETATYAILSRVFFTFLNRTYVRTYADKFSDVSRKLGSACCWSSCLLSSRREIVGLDSLLRQKQSPQRFYICTPYTMRQYLDSRIWFISLITMRYPVSLVSNRANASSSQGYVDVMMYSRSINLIILQDVGLLFFLFPVILDIISTFFIH